MPDAYGPNNWTKVLVMPSWQVLRTSNRGSTEVVPKSIRESLPGCDVFTSASRPRQPGEIN